MAPKLVAFATVLAMSACTSATVIDETRTVAVVETGFNAGERYEIRNRTLEGPNGRYEQTSVVYRGFARNCIRDSPNDCESKARNLIDEYNDRLFF